MIIRIRVIFGSGDPRLDGETLIIHTTEKPEKGMANRDIVNQVARFYGVSSTSVVIRSGFKSRRKVVELPDAVEKA